MKTKLTTLLLASAFCLSCPTQLTNQQAPQKTVQTPEATQLPARTYLTEQDVATIAKRRNARAMLIPVDYKYPFKDLVSYTISGNGQPVKSEFDIGKEISDLTGNYIKKFKGHYFAGIEGTLGVAVDNDSAHGIELRKCDTRFDVCTAPGYSMLVIGGKATPKEIRNAMTIFSAYVAERKELGITRKNLDTVAAGIIALSEQTNTPQ